MSDYTLIVTANDRTVVRNAGPVGPRGAAGLSADVIDGPLAAARTLDARLATNLAAVSSANQTRYVRMRGAHAGATGMWICVGASSGNISVGVVPNNGSSGLAARPSGARKATSGAVACPAAGAFTFVPFLVPVDIVDGDWFAISADNITATFGRATSVAPGGAGVAYQEAAHPIAANVGAVTASTSVYFAASR